MLDGLFYILSKILPEPAYPLTLNYKVRIYNFMEVRQVGNMTADDYLSVRHVSSDQLAHFFYFTDVRKN